MIWSGGVSVSGRNVAVCGGGGSRAGMETEEVKMRSFLWCDQVRIGFGGSLCLFF